MTTATEAVGAFLAGAYIAYGFALLILAFYGAHVLVLAVVWLVAAGRHTTSFRLLIEFLYGFVNPLIYLVLLRPGFATYEASFWKSLPLGSIAWVLLFALWGMRFFGGVLRHNKHFEAFTRLILSAALVCIVVFGIKDALLAVRELVKPEGGWLWNYWVPAAISPLYLIPAVFVLDYLRTSAMNRPRFEATFWLLSKDRVRVLGPVALTIALISAAVVDARPSDAAVRRLVHDHRNAIVEAGSEYGVDPRLLGSIIYVTHRDQLSPFRALVERMVIAAWLQDAKSHFFLAMPLNVSIGLTQIKPVTAQTAAMIVVSAKAGKWTINTDKEHREVPALGWSLPGAAGLSAPFPHGTGKSEVVKVLFDDVGNIRTCAFVLALYQVQWETADPSWSVRGRSEILATLFQLGFERSRPHPSPAPNSFGQRVGEVNNSAWLREAVQD